MNYSMFAWEWTSSQAGESMFAQKWTCHMDTVLASDFALVFHCNYMSILYGFRRIIGQKSAFFAVFTHPSLA